MHNRKTVFSVSGLQTPRAWLFAGLCLAMAANVHAQQGVLSFHGQVVNATCAVASNPAGTDRQNYLELQIQPGLRVQVDRSGNACAAHNLPFSTRFEPLSLPADEGRREVSRTGGVLIVTYQ